jgi:hypothetical protein
VPEEPEPWRELREGQQLEEILGPDLMREVRAKMAMSLQRQPERKGLDS